MDEVEGRLEVHGDDSVPLCFSHAHHESVFGDACVVDEDVDASEVSVHFAHHFSSFFKVGCVGGVGLSFHALRFDFFFCGFAVFVDDEVSESDVCAFFSEFQGNSLTDATCGTGDECGLSSEKSHIE